MNIVFVNIYPQGTMARYLYSAYVLKAYLQATIQGEVPKVDILNYSPAMAPETIAARVAKLAPDMVAYSSYIWNIETILEVVPLLRRALPEVLQVLGGPEITPGRVAGFRPENRADYYVIGEGERVFLRLVEQLRSGELDSLPDGVARHGEDGGIRFTPCEDGLLERLDDIPSVFLEGIMEERHYARQQAFLETQRGCRNRCKYCVYHRHRPVCSYYSLERIRAELDHLILDKGVTAVRFLDAGFTTDLERAKDIVRHLCDIKNRNNGVLPWIYWEFNYYEVDDEFFALTAGLREGENILNTRDLTAEDRPQHYTDLQQGYGVINCVGLQSFHKAALKAVGRFGIIKRRFEEFMSSLRRYNLTLKADLILGLPGETMDSYFEGLEYLIPFFRHTDHVLNIHRLQILPGSDLEDLCGEFSLDYSLDAPHLVFSTNTLTNEELDHASRLTALLFRAVNSPLREDFFTAWERRGGSLAGLLKAVYEALGPALPCAGIPLLDGSRVDDVYWNDKIFRDVPSTTLRTVLNSIGA